MTRSGFIAHIFSTRAAENVQSADIADLIRRTKYKVSAGQKLRNLLLVRGRLMLQRSRRPSLMHRQWPVQRLHPKMPRHTKRRNASRGCWWMRSSSIIKIRSQQDVATKTCTTACGKTSKKANRPTTSVTAVLRLPVAITSIAN